MPNEKLKEQNIKNVLSETLICFKEFGVEATTIKLLAERTGITTRSICRYFNGKKYLVLAAMNIFADGLFKKMNAGFRKYNGIGRNGLEQVMLYLDIQYEIFKTDYTGILLITEMERYFHICQEEDKQEILGLYIEKMSNYRKLLKSAVRNGIKDGSIRKDIDVELSTEMISFGFVGFLQRLAIAKSINEQLDSDIKLQAECHKGMIESYLKNRLD